MKASHVLLAIGVIFAVVVFQSAGVVSGWTNILTIVGAVVVLLILQKIPQVKFNTASWIFVAWFMFNVGLSMVWNQFSQKAPLTSEALSMRSEQADIIYGERTRPKALDELTALSALSEEAAKQRALVIIQNMNAAHARFLRKQISKEEYDVQMANFIAEAKRNKEWRERQSTDILSLDSNPHDKPLQEKIEELSNTPGRVVIWVMAIILLVGIAFSFWKNKAAVMKYAVLSVVVIATAFIADRITLSDLANKVSSLGPSPSFATTNQPIHRSINTVSWTTITIPSGPFDWEAPGDVEFKFSDGRIVKVKNLSRVDIGPIPGPIGKPRTFQVRGDPGEIVFQMK